MDVYAGAAAGEILARGRIADRSIRREAGGRTPTPGEFHVKADRRRLNGQDFARGYQVIEYPHIRRQHIYHAGGRDAESDRRQDARRT